MATKIFEVGSMANEDIQAWVGSAKFGTEDEGFEYADIDDGAFVVLGDLCDDDVYKDEKDWNCYQAKAPSAATLKADEVVVIDISGVSEGVIAGNSYKIGNKLVDLKCKAGYAARFRRLYKGDKFWLGEGNFVSAPTVGKYANLTANDVKLTPANSVTANQLNLVIRASKPITLGAHAIKNGVSTYEQIYLVEVL